MVNKNIELKKRKKLQRFANSEFWKIWNCKIRNFDIYKIQKREIFASQKTELF